MDWDEFDAKFRRIAEATDPNIRRIILDEFEGKWENLAFGILEMILYDRAKYSDVSYLCTKEREYAHKVADAVYLTNKLEEFKKEFRG